MHTLTKTPTDYADLALKCLRPAVSADLWHWCNNNLVMPSGNRWDPRRAGLMRHWYRIAGARLSLKPDARDPYAHRCEQLYLCISAQLAKTAFLHSVGLSSLANYSRQVGFFMSRKDDVKNARDRKLKRQVEKTPCIEQLLPRSLHARDQALGSLSWSIGSSLLYFRSASVADDLRADPMDTILMDEMETYPRDVEGYGDPIEQALARQRTFRRTKLLIGVTTPGTVSGHGWARVCSGSHERLLIPCPHCGGAQCLEPDQVCLTDGRELKNVSPVEISASHLGRFACKWCGTMWTADELHRAIRATIETDPLWCPGEWEQNDQHPDGRWKPTADFTSDGKLIRIYPSESTIRSGQANALYSLDETLDSYAMKMALALQGNESRKKTFTNNERAEPYIGTITIADSDDITTAAQPTDSYDIGHCPVAAPILFLMFDQQGNTREHYWFPWVLRAIIPGVGSWLVDEGAAKNDAESDALELKTWDIGGIHKRPDKIGRDSANGNYLFDAYLWAAKNPSRRILLRGDPRLPDGIPWQLVVDQPNARRRTPKPAGVKEYRIAPHYWRDRLWDSMRGMESESMKWYLPKNPSDRYRASLTSEEQIVEQRRVAGGYRSVTVWRPRTITSTADRVTLRDDNHWWDAEASVMAAINIFGWDKQPIIYDDVKPSSSGGGFMDGFV